MGEALRRQRVTRSCRPRERRDAPPSRGNGVSTLSVEPDRNDRQGHAAHVRVAGHPPHGGSVVALASLLARGPIEGPSLAAASRPARAAGHAVGEQGLFPKRAGDARSPCRRGEGDASSGCDDRHRDDALDRSHQHDRSHAPTGSKGDATARAPGGVELVHEARGQGSSRVDGRPGSATRPPSRSAPAGGRWPQRPGRRVLPAGKDHLLPRPSRALRAVDRPGPTRRYPFVA